MKPGTVIFMTLCLLSLSAVCAAKEMQAMKVELVGVGKSYLPAMEFSEGAEIEVRILVQRKPDSPAAEIVLSRFTQDQLKFATSFTTGEVVKRWKASDVKNGDVLSFIWKAGEKMRLGVGAGTEYATSTAEPIEDYHRLTFSYLANTWVLDVKFLKPAF
jgi:hypothetical protein